MSWTVEQPVPIHKIIFAGITTQVETTNFSEIVETIKRIARENGVTSRIIVRCDGRAIEPTDQVDLSYPRVFEITKTMEGA